VKESKKKITLSNTKYHLLNNNRVHSLHNLKIKTIVLDLGGVYFEAGTTLALKKIYKLVNASKERIDEVFCEYPCKEGWLYRKGKINKKEFWEIAVQELKIDKRMIPQLQKIWHSSYKPIKGMKKIVHKLRQNYRIIVFSDNIEERIEYLDSKYNLRREFDSFVLSFQHGFSKKEIEFYKILLKKIACNQRNLFLLMIVRNF